MQQFLVNETEAERRYFYLHLVDATDGLTPETGEAGGQPQISKNGAGFGNTSATLTAIGNGAYYVALTAGEVDTLGTVMVRYKSANTLEFQDIAYVVSSNIYADISGDIAEIKTDIAAIETDVAAIEVDAAAIEANIGDMSGDVLQSIKDKLGDPKEPIGPWVLNLPLLPKGASAAMFPMGTNHNGASTYFAAGKTWLINARCAKGPGTITQVMLRVREHTPGNHVYVGSFFKWHPTNPDSGYLCRDAADLGELEGSGPNGEDHIITGLSIETGFGDLLGFFTDDALSCSEDTDLVPLLSIASNECDPGDGGVFTPSAKGCPKIMAYYTPTLEFAYPWEATVPGAYTEGSAGYALGNITFDPSAITDAIAAAHAITDALIAGITFDPAAIIAAVGAAHAVTDALVAAIKAKTDNLPPDPVDESSLAAALAELSVLIAALPTLAALDEAHGKGKWDQVGGGGGVYLAGVDQMVWQPQDKTELLKAVREILEGTRKVLLEKSDKRQVVKLQEAVDVMLKTTEDNGARIIAGQEADLKNVKRLDRLAENVEETKALVVKAIPDEKLEEEDNE